MSGRSLALSSLAALAMVTCLGTTGAGAARRETEPGGSDIYAFAANGSEVRKLTHDGRSAAPSVSPDGRIAFYHVGGLEEPGQIYVMNADGSNVRRLTDAPFQGGYLISGWEGGIFGSPDRDLVWSPDSRKIAFGTFREDPPCDEPCGHWQLRLLDVASGSTQVLADDSVRDPIWSPDGRKIAFLIGFDEGGSWEYHLVDVVRLSDGHEWKFTGQVPCGDGVESPSWAPDSLRLAYDACRRGSRTIWIRIATLRGRKSWFSAGIEPSWAPKGSKIAFLNLGRNSVFVRALSGRPRRLVRTGLHDLYRPIWSPDGRRLAVAADDGDGEDFGYFEGPGYLYVVNARGPRRVRTLFDGRRQHDTPEAVDNLPAWSKDGKWIYASIWHGPGVGP